jgi:putative DNA primase/helicase
MQRTSATAERPIDEIISTFRIRGQEIEQRGIYYITNCPGPNHINGDKNPSLHFWEVEDDEGKKTVAFNCFSGQCRRVEILKALNIELSTIPGAPTRNYAQRPILTLADLEQHTMIDWRVLFNLGINDGVVTFHRSDGTSYKERGIVIPYYKEDGSLYERCKIRLSLEKLEGKAPRFKWSEGDEPPIAYGLQYLDKAREQGYIVIEEGESDFWTLYAYDIPALGIPGADNVKKTLDASLLKDIPRVYVIQETTDQAGQNFPFAVKRQLMATGYTGEVLRVPLRTLTGAKDPNELHKKLFDRENPKASMLHIKELFLQVLQEAKPMEEDTGKSETQKLCDFDADDAGNGDAMHYLYGDQFLYCGTWGWLKWTGKYWKVDSEGAQVKQRAVSALRKRRIAAVSEEREQVVKVTRADDRRVNGCINRFKTLVNIEIGEFDNNADLLNCRNGVVDLRTGQITPHSHIQRFTYCLPVDYEPSECPEWLEYLHSVVGGGQEVIDYLQKACGYSLTGHTNEEILFYLFGPTRSGKGTFAEIFLSLLPDPLSTMVDFNSFTAKREGDVSNFDLAPLKPARMIFASESNKSQSLNPAKIKQLTGGDLIRASLKHRDFFSYRPQYKVWMLSNWPVNGDPEDDALWGRVRVIQFPNSFLGKEDKGKKVRLKQLENLKGILYWAVQGAIAWYQLGPSGLQTPAAITETTNNQRADLDYVDQWLAEYGRRDPEEWTSNEDVMHSYLKWCEENNVQYTKGPKSLAQSLQHKGFQTGIQRKIWVNAHERKNKKGVLGLSVVFSLEDEDEDEGSDNGNVSVTGNGCNVYIQQTPVIEITKDEIPKPNVTTVTRYQTLPETEEF